MKVNLEIVTKEAVFNAGTIGGSWLWQLIKTGSLGAEPTGPEAAAVDQWATVESFTSRDVDPESTYKISGVRLDSDKNPLGTAASSAFSTEAAPTQVKVDVADSINVEVVI